MPAANKNNPYHCDRPMRKNGKAEKQAQKYRCSCGFTLTILGRPVGRQSIGDRPMTPYERELRWKERDPIGYEAARLRKQENRKARRKK